MDIYLHETQSNPVEYFKWGFSALNAFYYSFYIKIRTIDLKKNHNF